MTSPTPLPATHRLLDATRHRDGVWALGPDHGFLPAKDPIAVLPAPFEDVQAVLDRMPVRLEDGRPGLLATPGQLADAVASLADHHDAVAALDPSHEDDARLLAALFRSYTFLASAYTLAPAHHHQLASAGGCPAHGGTPSGAYGEARQLLPANLARPLVAAADALEVQPWLDYHYAYSLYNWAVVDDTVPAEDRMRWDNLRMAARFSGQPDEAGFILLHVHIDSHSGPLLGSLLDGVRAASAIRQGQNAWADLRDALARHRDTLCTINDVRREMWKASRWRHYNDFRVFIMGITGNEALFGDGLVYEGVERFGGAPQQFRGQTGAQDDIIPTVDLFAGVDAWYPDTELTRYLLELRAYRPKVVRTFLSDLTDAVSELGLAKLIQQDPEATVRLMEIVEQVHAFRNGHWQFVQKYILATTRYAVATGGTPITTWIPNQIEATLAYLGHLIDRVAPEVASLSDDARAAFCRIRDVHRERVDILHAQVAELSQTDWNAQLVFDLNARFKEDPAA